MSATKHTRGESTASGPELRHWARPGKAMSPCGVRVARQLGQNHQLHDCATDPFRVTCEACRSFIPASELLNPLCKCGHRATDHNAQQHRDGGTVRLSCRACVLPAPSCYTFREVTTSAGSSSQYACAQGGWHPTRDLATRCDALAVSERAHGLKVGCNADIAKGLDALAAPPSVSDSLRAAAPDMADALRSALAWFHDPDADPTEEFERIAAEYQRDTGYLRPGKDEPMETRRDSCSEENRARFYAWCQDRSRKALAVMRAALSKAEGRS